MEHPALAEELERLDSTLTSSYVSLRDLAIVKVRLELMIITVDDDIKRMVREDVKWLEQEGATG